jgi:DNA-binding NarL/FixJ family response regulator
VARNRIVIADQNPAIRQFLVDLLQEDAEIVATVDDGEAVAAVVEAVNPNLVLLGVNFQGTTGFEIARRLRQQNYPVKIIIVSLYESKDMARAALAIGASGYVFLSRLLDDLPAAINAACEGNVFESN